MSVTQRYGLPVLQKNMKPPCHDLEFDGTQESVIFLVKNIMPDQSYSFSYFIFG